MADAGVVAFRYAHALAGVVAKQGLDAMAIRGQLQDFMAVFGENAALREVLMDPSIPSEQKLAVLDGIAERLGMLREVRNFLAVIMDHTRLHELDGILAAYDGVSDVGMGVTEAEVTSVHELEDAERAQLAEQVARLAGTKVRIAYKLDPALLGGAVVRIGSKVYDGSVRTQLERMRQTLVNA